MSLVEMVDAKKKVLTKYNYGRNNDIENWKSIYNGVSLTVENSGDGSQYR